MEIAHVTSSRNGLIKNHHGRSFAPQ